MEVAEKVQDPDSHTLKTRPWRRHTTPFSDYLKRNYRGSGTEQDPFVINWEDDDPENPQTFGAVYKWTITGIVAIATLAVALASSIYSGAIRSIEAEFNPSTEVAILGVSLFVVGFAAGPLLWAPISEVTGRRNILIGTYIMFTLWNSVACAAQNMASLIVFRFLAGLFGSSPLTNAGGTISDMFNAKMRGLATAIFAAAPFLGPALGPIAGGFLGEAAGWRWVQGLLGIFTAVLTVICFLFVPETYAPTILRKRAALLSKVTGKVYRAPMDAKKPLQITALFKTSLSRPWALLLTEPIVLLISIYMAIVYGTLYMLFAAFPIVFQQVRGWSPGIGGLAFLGVLVGMLLGVLYVIVYDNPRYVKLVDKRGGRAPPETRLPASMLGSVLLIIGLAWFAATNGPSVHYVVPILAGVPFAMGMLLIFLPMMNYLIDSYTVYAASVLAANSVLRSLFGAAFPLFTTPMYRNLGIHWASAVPGFLALACLPFPFLFYKYGASIRAKCKYTQQAETLLQEMMEGEKHHVKGETQQQEARRESLGDDAEGEVDDYPPSEERSGSAPSEHTLADDTNGQPKRKPTP